MKYIFTFLILVFFHPIWALPKAYFDYKTFYTNTGEAYVENTMQISSGTVKFLANQNGFLQSKLEITQLFKQNDKIISVDKYILLSPEMKDSIVEDFYDLKRFKLPAGVYDFELEIKDLNNDQMVSGSFEIEVKSLNPNKIESSNIEFVQTAIRTDVEDSFTKNGYRLLPYFTNYFPPQYTKIIYYLELYNTNMVFSSEDLFAATFQVKDLSTGQFIEECFQYKKLKSSSVIPIINILPIESLRSGFYQIVCQIVNAANEPVFEKSFDFKRRNDIEFTSTDITNIDISQSFTNLISSDSIHYYVGSLMPISSRGEYEKIRIMLNDSDTTYLKKYFHNYWKETAPTNPNTAWLKYKKQVQYTQKLFGTHIKYGYETDRGRVYLKYGAPNFVTERPNEINAYPYEIWHYYKVEEQSNRRFVFYNPDLITNDYPLLHSDMRGELNNTRWQYELYKRNTPPSNIDNENMQEYNNHGTNSGIFYQN